MVGGHRAAGRSVRPVPVRAGRPGVRGDRATGSRGSPRRAAPGDANGQYIRVAAGGGANTVKIPDALPNPDGLGLQDAVGLTAFPILGAMPQARPTRRRHPFKPNKPCERQEPPNLQAGAGAGPETASAPQPDAADVLSSATRGDIRAAADQFGLTRAADEAADRARPEAVTDGDDDPQAPARLHRRRGADRGRARDHRLHPRGAAAADPGVRGEAVRAEGPVRHRAGRRSGSGPVDPRRRGQDRRRRRRRARRRQGRGHVRHRAQVPADLQGRDDPDAPDDRRSRTCSSSSTRARKRPASTTRATRSRLRTRRPTSTSTRSSRRSTPTARRI